jgi:hypothetical protein
MRRTVLLAVLTALLGPQRSTSAAQPEPADQPFHGKYLIICVKAGDKFGCSTLKNVKVKQLGARTFLVGEYASEIHDTYKPWKGIRCWVPVDEISNIHEFDDAEQARKMAPPGPTMKAVPDAPALGDRQVSARRPLVFTSLPPGSRQLGTQALRPTKAWGCRDSLLPEPRRHLAAPLRPGVGHPR